MSTRLTGRWLIAAPAGAQDTDACLDALLAAGADAVVLAVPTPPAELATLIREYGPDGIVGARVADRRGSAR